MSGNRGVKFPYRAPISTILVDFICSGILYLLGRFSKYGPKFRPIKKNHVPLTLDISGTKA